MFESGRRLSKLGSRTKTLMISNKEMNDIMKIVKSLDESGLLIKLVRRRALILTSVRRTKRRISQYG